MTTFGDAAAGRALFVANCAACHGVAGNGGSIGYGWVAPPLRGVTAQQLVEAVRAGPGVMPRFDPHGLSGAQLGDVVAYVELLNEHMPNAGGFGLGDIGPVAEGAIAWFAMAALIVVVRRLGSND
jgi:ubiquinol-cytochrome c reductase cytochrome c subunit